MPGPEALIERACLQYAKTRGCELLKVKFSGRRGFPDRMLITPTTAAPLITLIEFKRSKRLPTRAQQAVHKELSDLGLTVWTIDSELKFIWRLSALLL